MQVLQADWDRTFSEHSFGFRPGRSAHQAVERAQAYIASGHAVVVDIDLEKFFDRVNHDILMGLVAKRVADKRLLKLIRGFLERGGAGRRAGQPDGGRHAARRSALAAVVEPDAGRAGQGTGEARPPLRALRRRLQHLCAQSDGGRAGDGRASNGSSPSASSSRSTRPRARSPNRASASSWASASRAGSEPRRRIAPQSLARFKAKVRELTRRTRGRSLAQIVKELSVYLIGWRGYFGFCQTPSVLRELDEWIRRRLRAIAWKQWKRGRTRFAELRRRGVGRDLAAQTAGSPHGPWRLSNSPALTIALPNAFFSSLGLPSIAHHRPLNPPNRRDTDPYVRWCGRGRPRGSPLSRLCARTPPGDHRRGGLKQYEI